MTRLVYIVTHPMTARYLLAGQLAWMGRRGFQVHLITSPGPELEAVREQEAVRIHTLPMHREISPLRDLVSLLRLAWLLRRLRPEVVNAGTPKAGLLGMLAARLNRVPLRLYTLRGLRLETARGLKRRLLAWGERAAAASAHRVLAVSESLRSRCLRMGLAPADKVGVLASGSSNGVDAARFAATPELCSEAAALRRRLGIPTGAPVVGFVGRLTRDKGVAELIEAFAALADDVPEARLLVVGGAEAGDPIGAEADRKLRCDPRVVLAGFVADTRAYYPMMDILVLPSFREGFPNAPLEAAAAGVPTVGFAATGTVDAVVDGATGTLAPVGDARALAAALKRYLEDPELRRAHGEAAELRVRREFQPERVWQALEAEIRRLLARREAARRPTYPPWLARALDLALAVPALLLTAPVMVVVALLVRWRLGPPVLFRQVRPGLGGEPFVVLKFRTMREAADEAGRPLPDGERLTPLGRFLRATSLDELPELVNVLKGEMRLVGPRPLLMEYLDRYTPHQARRHEVRPGLTGWAQIHGRNVLSWEDRFALDVWYVDHRSLWLDLRILGRTLVQVLRRRGISAEGHPTMPVFRGSEGPERPHGERP